MQIEVIRSRRKTVGIQIIPPGRIVVRAPLALPQTEIQRILDSKRAWIEKHLASVRQRETEKETAGKLSWDEVEELGNRAVKELPPRLRELAKQVGVTYGRVTVRNQKTRWGSCSAQGNLNFNCLLMLCPRQVADYVMIHELCHRKELNHSPRFWAEVERVMPDYRDARNWLKEHGPALIARLPNG